MGCKAAKYEPSEGRYKCDVSGVGCMYFIPDSKRCAEEWGEGPDAERNRCEDCAKFYIKDNKRCCKDEPLCFKGGEIVPSEYIDDDVICCGGFVPKEGAQMNKYDIAGILRTYSEKCANANSEKQIKEIIKRLKEELKEAINA